MTERAFDPRDFISSPFKTCPECGHDAFGVLTIGKDSYSRRCRDCWHMVRRIPLPPVRKKIIYLDRYVVSNLVPFSAAECSVGFASARSVTGLFTKQPC
jgi:hypothetical protein